MLLKQQTIIIYLFFKNVYLQKGVIFFLKNVNLQTSCYITVAIKIKKIIDCENVTKNSKPEFFDNFSKNVNVQMSYI